jgi:hypothetical protein
VDWRHYPRWPRFPLYAGPVSVSDRLAVFEGLRRDEDEDRRGVGWRCYCGVADCSYRRDGTEAAPYPNKVYFMFVNDEGVAYNLRWEKADPDKPALPVDYQTRLKKRLL